MTLVECTTPDFLQENTLAQDDNPVYVDKLVQTVHKGPALRSTSTQSPICLFLCDTVVTDNILSNISDSGTSTQTILTYRN